jgi:hypothetical protein
VHDRARLLHERAPVVALRFLELPLGGQRVGDVVVGGRVLRVEVDRLAELLDRLVRPALAREDVSRPLCVSAVGRPAAPRDSATRPRGASPPAPA